MNSAEILGLLVRTNIVAAAVIAIVMILRKPVQRLAGARCAYGLWLLPPVVTAASLIPPGLFSQAETPLAIQPVVFAAQWFSETSAAQSAADYSPLLLSLWLAGSALSLLVLALRQRRFTVALGTLIATPDDSVLRAGASTAGPAVVGGVRPKIILPADFETRFAIDERDIILAHERAHLAAGHAQTNALAAALACLNWFNPLVHVAIHLMRMDQELACDAAVIAKRPGARKPYAAAMLKAQLVTTSLPLGCYWPARSPHPLKERIVMLNRKTPGRAARLAATIAITALAAGGSYAAWAAQPTIANTVAAQTSPKTVTTPLPAPQPQAPTLAVATAAQPVAPKAVRRVPLTAVAQTAPVGTVTRPEWVERPTGEDVVKVYPKLAAGETGKALLQCIVGGGGEVTACTVTSESPIGSGVGDAAKKLTPRFRMKLNDAQEKPSSATRSIFPSCSVRCDGLA